MELHPIPLAAAVSQSDAMMQSDRYSAANRPIDEASSEGSASRPTASTAAVSGPVAAEGILICHWDVRHPLGRLLFLRLPRHPIALPSSSLLSGRGPPPVGPPKVPLIVSSDAGAETDVSGQRGTNPQSEFAWLSRSRLLQARVHGRQVMTVHEELGPEDLEAIRITSSSIQVGIGDAAAASGIDPNIFRASDGDAKKDTSSLCTLHISIFDVTSVPDVGQLPSEFSPIEMLIPSALDADCLGGHDISNLSSDPVTVSPPCLSADTSRWPLHKAHCTVVFPIPFIHLLSLNWNPPPPNKVSVVDNLQSVEEQPSLQQQQGRDHTVKLVYSSLGMVGQKVSIPLQEGQLDDRLVVPPDPSSSPQRMYSHRRLWATSDDGTPVAISLVLRQPQSGGSGTTAASPPCDPLPAPGSGVLLRAYGAFGLPDDLDYQAGR